MSKTILEFADAQGHMAVLGRRLSELRASQQSAIAKRNLRGWLMSAIIEGYLEGRVGNLHARARKMMLHVLRDSPVQIHLIKVAPQTVSNGFRTLEFEYQALAIADRLELARDYWFTVN